MKKGLLSILIFARTEAAIHFRRTLISITEQTYQSIEIIAAGFKDFLSLELAAYPDVVQMPWNEEQSFSHVRNTALQLMNGEFSAFVEVGDIWDSDKAEKMIAQFDSDSALSVLCGNGIAELNDNNILSARMIFHHSSNNPFDWLADNSIFFCSQMAYRTSALINSGGFDENLLLLADLDMAIRISVNDKALFLSEPLFYTDSQTEDSFGARLYHDRRVMYDKYADQFLVNRQLSYLFLLELAKASLDNGLYSHTMMYFIRAAARRPIHMIAYLAHRMSRGLFGLFSMIFHYAIAVAQSFQLLYRIVRGSFTQHTSRTQGQVHDVSDAERFAQNSCFHYAHDLKLNSIIIPMNIKRIKAGMFFGCMNLEEVVLPASVNRIDAFAFMGCSNLKKVEISAACEDISIGSFAFSKCLSLQQLVLPYSIHKIGNAAFAGCCNLKEINFVHKNAYKIKTHQMYPNTLRSLGWFAFCGCESLKSIIFQKGSLLTRLSFGLFYKCSNLSNVEITGVIKAVEPWAFYGCEMLSYLGMRYNDCIEYIGPRAFMLCKALNTVEVPVQLTRIRKRTYEGCEKIVSVKIPEQIKKVEYRAFAGCSALEKVNMLNRQTQYDETAFPKGAIIDVYADIGGSP